MRWELMVKAHKNKRRRWKIERKSIYLRWKRMVARCYLPNTEDYPRYGEQGITVCDTWRYDFHSFQAWCLSVIDYPAEGRENYVEIHRLDNNGNYEPDNCVLITPSEHSILTHQDRTKESYHYV